MGPTRLRRHFRTSRVRRSSPPRRIVGWAMHANLTQGLAQEALAMALADRH